MAPTIFAASQSTARHFFLAIPALKDCYFTITCATVEQARAIAAKGLVACPCTLAAAPIVTALRDWLRWITEHRCPGQANLCALASHLCFALEIVSPWFAPLARMLSSSH